MYKRAALWNQSVDTAKAQGFIHAVDLWLLLAEVQSALPDGPAAFF